ncbi:hypothetical protein [Pseudarthrobacter sp. BIM B-2242]|uniref:hypothetical protein n=1 Tax=Pseudarthrobacter sp. BIM B-2242 TaxID=2772401 RepID=UPI00168A6A88|nr:hypothetical protein [Pseudarthrobacter sp. BIM B-2242]QOD05742.1 hypothetical protein IDT60_22150 [Pseudarthrobacter sp. BIM B-2242]
MEGLEARVLNEYPPGSAIISAEKVRTGGIGGFLAKTHFEVVVEVPDAAPTARFPTMPRQKSSSHPVPPRAGVAALLADADKADAAMHGAIPKGPSTPELSTTTRSFGELMESLEKSTLSDGPESAKGPEDLLTGAGDVILVAGLGADALATVRSMAAVVRSSSILTAGSFRAYGTDHIVSRQGLVTAQAAAVIAREPLFVAFGLGTDGSLRTNALTELKADQVWVVVDATRKHTDTEAWVKKVGWSAPVQALAVVNYQDTRTPETVHDLDLPIGWIDGRRAKRSTT